tara:strand:+ start:206 stop:412 length:207 start_codon:yes stop_codon:yes gene_type:complete
MTTTVSIIDMIVGLTEDQLIAVGSAGQVMLKTVITDEADIITSEDVEFFDTVEEATAVKTERDKINGN